MGALSDSERSEGRCYCYADEKYHRAFRYSLGVGSELIPTLEEKFICCASISSSRVEVCLPGWILVCLELHTLQAKPLTLLLA